jgi:hypothetical protein
MAFKKHIDNPLDVLIWFGTRIAENALTAHFIS